MTPALDPALLAALLDPANDQDDGLRLACSDCLEENGQPERAEFVRVQVELARPSDCETCSGRRWYEITDLESEDCFACTATLRRREGELLSAVQDDTKAALCGQEDCWIDAWNFRRGFVHAITLSAADWLTHADRLLACQPIREVALTSLPEVEWQAVGGTRCRLRGRPSWLTWGYSHEPPVARLLAAEWPQVRKWHLPATVEDFAGITGEQVFEAVQQQYQPHP